MSRISSGYLISIVVWLIVGLAFIILNRNYNILSIDDTNLVLGTISVAISILSLGLATIRLPEFKGKIECWNNKTEVINVNNEGRDYQTGTYKLISFKIQNKDKQPIKSLVVNFRFPKNIYRNKIQDNLRDKEINIKDTVIYTSDAIKFLGVNQGDCELIFEHYIQIQKMNRSNIYMTISGDNIRPTTFKINKELGENIDVSNSKQTIQLPRVK